MSTRRPRIKAVAALPPRRKNAETSEVANKKPQPPKDVAEEILASPKTPRTYSKSEDKPSPGTASILSPPSLPLISAPKETAVPQIEPIPSTIESPTTNSTCKTTPNSERAMQVPVITPTPNFKNKPNMFASPRIRNSPDQRTLMSPPAKIAPRTLKSVEMVQKVPFTPIQPTVSFMGTRDSVLSQDSGINVRTVDNTPATANSTPASSGKRTNDGIVDYSIQRIPESIPEDPVMDGIVPLLQEKTAPKPIDLLKNEIISEHAEVLFDPIVPLPSPSKVRPKLRPVPRLAPHRRNSIQGSASESEDESRRALLGGNITPAPPRQRHDSHVSTTQTIPARIRNDSVSSNCQQPIQPPPALSPVKEKHFSKSLPDKPKPLRDTQRLRELKMSTIIGQLQIPPPPALSPVKEKHFSKCRRQEMSKRMWRRRRDTVKRDSLTMYDLIFYNPTTNPFVPDQEEIKAKEENAKEAEKAAQAPEDENEEPPTAAPVPQIKLGPNGEIVLDEKSLVIKQSDANRKVSSVVREGSWAGSGCGRYTRMARTADWPMAETVRFYRALAALGTDFTLMAPLFPDRTRRDLKLKFKKEERVNGGQVDKALRSATSWDATGLLEEFEEERKLAAKQAEADRLRLIAEKKAEKQRVQAAKEQRCRASKSSKALESRVEQFAKSREMDADDIVYRAIKNKADQLEEAVRQSRLKSAEKKKPKPVMIPSAPSPYATLTLLRRPTPQTPSPAPTPEVATLSRTNPTPSDLAPPSFTESLETGSLVVLRANNPVEPTKTMLQTYISHADGKLTPINLPPALLKSVVGYVKNGTPGIGSASSSPFTSPLNLVDRVRDTPLNLSPTKRARLGSWDVTTL